MKIKRFALLCLIPLSLMSLAACTNEKENDVVGSFGDTKISKDELYDTLVAQYGNQALEVLLVNEVAKKEAEKMKISVEDTELDEEINLLSEQYGGMEAFNEVLASSNLTVEDVKKDIKSNLILEKVLSKDIKVSDDEIKAYFDENKDSFVSEEQVEASHILLDTKEKADELLAQLEKGADFAKLAKENSTDTASAAVGGDLGFFGKGAMVEPFEEAAFAMEVGKMEVVESEFGFHLIKVTDKKPAAEAKFEDAKDEITESLVSQKMQAEYSTWVTKKFEEYKVETFIN